MQIISETDDLARNFGKPMGLVPMSPDDMLRNGVRGYFPQVANISGALNESEMAKNILRAHRIKQQQFGGPKMTENEALLIARSNLGNKRGGVKRANNLDFQRSIPGSTGQKVAAGFDMLDPRSALRVYGDSIALRYGLGRRIGPQGELINAYKMVAEREGANMARVNTAVDMMTGQTFFGAAMTEFANYLTAPQILMKLGLAAIPNMSQQINNVLLGGLRNQARAIRALASKEERSHMAQAMASQEGVLSSLQQGLLAGGEAKGLKDVIISGALTAFGFTPIENLNRYMSGMVGIALARDISAKAVSGRLKGASLDRARRQMASVGLDLGAITRRGDLTEPELIEAAVRMTRQTQFVPDPTRLPTLWKHPVGRIFTQFKTFAFSQAKMIRENVFREAMEGNYRPLAYFLTLYPAAGEMVNSTIDMIKERKRPNAFDPTAPFTDLERYVETMAAVGGFGLFYNMGLSAQAGDLGRVFAGPSFSDAFDIGQILANEDRLENAQKKFERLPIYTYGKVSVTGIEAGLGPMIELLDQIDRGPKPTRKSERQGRRGIFSIEQKRFEDAQDKR
jgi:hypothetical protein